MSTPGSTRRAQRHRRAIVACGPAVVLLPLSAAVAACGGPAGSVASTPDAAQRQLIAAADRLDACFAKRSDTRKCTGEDTLGDAPLGDGAGEIQVNATRPTRYQLTIKVDDRTSFAILAQPVGARKRVCAPAGAGGCEKGGVW